MAIDRDIRLSGFASYVGKSSMEVTLEIDQVRFHLKKKRRNIDKFI